MIAFLVFEILLFFFDLKPVSCDWSTVTKYLDQGVAKQVFPGYVALTGYRNGTILYQHFDGNFVYESDDTPPYNNGTNPSLSLWNQFDMASVTKLMSTTSSIIKLLTDNILDSNALYSKIIDYLPSNDQKIFSEFNKSNITILNCLLHNAGWYPDPYPYWFSSSQFNCPETNEIPSQLSFDCTQKIYNSWLNQSLMYPTGTEMVYSDLSMMSLSYVIGHVVKNKGIIGVEDIRDECLVIINNTKGDDNYSIPLICYYEAYARKYVFEGQELSNYTGFLPKKENYGNCLPTANDTNYRHKILQGQVEDPNAFANGGIFGHAGLFSTVMDVYKWAKNILTSDYYSLPYYNYSTVSKNNDHDHQTKKDYFFDPQWTMLFLTQFNHLFSSRGLGFDTNSYDINDFGETHVCGQNESIIFDTISLHTGFTGTMFCLDRERDLIYILLTNRVWPLSNSNFTFINEWRMNYAEMVINTIDKDLIYLKKQKSSNSFVPLFKQCNDTWRGELMNTQTLCNDWIYGSLVSSIAMGLNFYNVKINNSIVIDPSTLNQWIQLSCNL